MSEETEWSIIEINDGQILKGSRSTVPVPLERSSAASDVEEESSATSGVEEEEPSKPLSNGDGTHTDTQSQPFDPRANLSKSAPHILDRSRGAVSPVVLALSQKGVMARTRLIKSGEAPPSLFMDDEVQEIRTLSKSASSNDDALQMRQQVLKMSYELGLQNDEPPAGVSMSDQDDDQVEAEPEELEECVLCLDDKPPTQFVELPCLHRYCDTCFDYYMKMETKKDEMTEMRCPNTDCRQQMSQSFLKSIGAKRQIASLKKNEKKKQRQLDSMSRSGRSRAFLCAKLILGTIRNGLFCGWFCPQDDGCAICWLLCSCGGMCCNCFCGYCFHASCCQPLRHRCGSVTDCYWLDDCPVLNFTCWHNDIEYCPYCCSLVQYTGGCPNIHCRVCGTHYVRDQQCNFPCICCVFGMYVPLNFNVFCGEGKCCEAPPNCWCQKI